MKYNYIFRLDQKFLGENKLTVETRTVPEYPLHSHTYYEMAIYFDGEGILNLNGTSKNINTTTIVMVTPSDFHGFSKVDGNLKSIKIAFDETLIDDISILPQNAIVLECKENAPFLKSIFKEILDCMNEKKYVSFLISSLILKLTQKGASIVSTTNDPKYERVSKAIKEINNNFCESISLTGISQSLNITPQYLSKIF